MTAQEMLRRTRRAIQMWRRDRRAYYLDVFGHPETRNPGQVAVLADLRGFCYADKRIASVARNGAVDTHAMALLEGRREVWLRISRFLNLTEEQLARIEQTELLQRRNTELRADEDDNAA